MKIDFDKMSNTEKLAFLMERNGYIEDGIGLNEYGHEFRDDEGQALFIKNTTVTKRDRIKNIRKYSLLKNLFTFFFFL